MIGGKPSDAEAADDAFVWTRNKNETSPKSWNPSTLQGKSLQLLTASMTSSSEAADEKHHIPAQSNFPFQLLITSQEQLAHLACCIHVTPLPV
jgi:hypothetical protein